MYDFDWKQERIDGVVREIERKSLQEIAMIILTERFHRKAKEYEVNWLDELAGVPCRRWYGGLGLCGLVGAASCARMHA